MSKPPPTPLFTFKGLMKGVHSLLFDLDGRECIYSGTQDGKIFVWDLKTNRELASYTIGKETCLAIHKIKLENFDQRLITQEKGGIFRFWFEDLKNNEIKLQETVDMNYFGFCRGVVTKNCEYIISPSNNGIVKLIPINKPGDMNNYIELNDMKNVDKIGEIMVIKLVKSFILVIYEAGVVKIWSIDSKICINTIQLITDCPMAFDLSSSEINGQHFLGYIGSNSEVVTELNIDFNDNISIVNKRKLHITNPGVSNIKIRSDNKLFVISCWDKCLRLFSCKSMKLLVVLDLHKDVIQDILFSDKHVDSWNCDNLLAVGCSDGRISLWNLY